MSKQYKSDLYEIECVLHFETEKAILVSLDGDNSKGVWLPKSRIEWEKIKGAVVKITAPEQYLIDKELI